MNHYDITVIYACHGLETDPRKPFPAQNFPADGLQIVSIWENDPFDPRKNSLAAIKEAEGTYTILLDEGDVFPNDFLLRMQKGAADAGTAFAMPAFFFPRISG